jgi:hypothetical protein
MRLPLSETIEAAAPVLSTLPVETNMAKEVTQSPANAGDNGRASSADESSAGVAIQAPLGTCGAPKRLDSVKWVTILVWMDRPYAHLKDIPLRFIFRFLIHFAGWCNKRQSHKTYS